MNKYVVLKREDFNKCMMALRLEVSASIVEDISNKALDDCVVIRKKDVFSATALYAYAGAITSAREILMELGASQEQLDHMSRIADYFAGEADEARKTHGRIPT